MYTASSARWPWTILFPSLLLPLLSLSLLFILTGCRLLNPGPEHLFWQIGRPDGDNREFALAPDDSAGFQEDGFFVVGQSDSRSDWPYVHPGPGDLWAGRRVHTFTILFGVKHPPNAGRCRLQLKLLDTHKHNPPRLRATVNGQTYEQDLPPGAGDASLQGDPGRGRATLIQFDFPASTLKTGDNEIKLTALSGSWFLYDWVGLYLPEKMENRPVTQRDQVLEVNPLHRLRKESGRKFQTVRVRLRHLGEPGRAVVRVDGTGTVTATLKKVSEEIDVPVPAVQREKKVRVTLETEQGRLDERDILLKPLRPMTIFILPHSHTDVGYTENQDIVAKKTVDHLLQGMEIAKRTAGYPEGARFVWNAEVMWAADLLLRRGSPGERAAFLQAVQKGQVALNGLYLDALTGLCRPEELLRLFRESVRVGEITGVPIDSAMLSDVPGATWGTVSAMAQAGIRYFSAAPNHFDRIGNIMEEWEDRPFYWLSPSGKEKVLVWVPYKGYALSHLIRRLTPGFLEAYQARLDKLQYPYDLTYLRWSARGDNAPPDPAICDFVREWNATYLSPRLVIASTSTAFRALEERYGKRLPRLGGDWTPYWEDGAGSSARETALNRASSDRLVQAAALWAMLDPAGFPAAAFEEAWRQVLLFSEHTWGADVSISNPDGPKTREQWEIKKSYALQADILSRDLLARGLSNRRAGAAPDNSPGTVAGGKPAVKGPAVDVFNTVSWFRTELVTLASDFPRPGDRVVDDQDRPVPSQRLRGGELVFLAREVPPFAGRRYRITSGAPFSSGRAEASGCYLKNENLTLGIDEKTGSIVEFRARGIEGNLVDTSGGRGWNEYLYLKGDNPADLQRTGPVTIRVRETGPLVASLVVESEAPGCRKLIREVRLTAASETVELINVVDKEKLKAKSYYAKEGKEGVHFAFPFHIPDAQIRLDIPWAVMRPEQDQLPGSCKNWLTMGRWADVSNENYGVTWFSLDAPLVQVGGITATLLNSQTDSRVWRKEIEPTQRLYSWVMNNHWGTNYRAFQEGPVVFRYLLRPHRGFDPAEASRLAIGQSRPLITATDRGPAPSNRPLFRVPAQEVLVSSLKPSDDGKAWIIRLFEAGGRRVRTPILWGGPEPKSVWLSNTGEKALKRMNGPIEVPAYGLVTVRVEK